jgi:hypothetical protein
MHSIHSLHSMNSIHSLYSMRSILSLHSRNFEHFIYIHFIIFELLWRHILSQFLENYQPRSLWSPRMLDALDLLDVFVTYVHPISQKFILKRYIFVPSLGVTFHPLNRPLQFNLTKIFHTFPSQPISRRYIPFPCIIIILLNVTFHHLALQSVQSVIVGCISSSRSSWSLILRRAPISWTLTVRTLSLPKNIQRSTKEKWYVVLFESYL